MCVYRWWSLCSFPPHWSQPCRCRIKRNGKMVLVTWSVRNHVRRQICSLYPVCVRRLLPIAIPSAECDLSLMPCPSLVYFSQHGFWLFPLASTVTEFLSRLCMRLECLTHSIPQYRCKITAHTAEVQVSSSAVKILARLKYFPVRTVLIGLQVAYQSLQIV